MVNETQKQNNNDNPRGVSPRPGSQKQSRNRWLNLDGAGNEKNAEWFAGSEIEYLMGVVTVPLGGPALAGDEYVLVAIDPIDDATGDLMLTQIESLTDDVQWLPILPNKPTPIPLTALLSNGTLGGGVIRAKTVGGAALDLFIGAN